ncbi:hypothetical protein [Lacticaseibacillus paracasei]|uniref:hypothetical protein n=1 Tax=Lacticaseibacillus paracasei TaxID=1597 RepID=UPI000F0B364B|nr:hypothetical protein [Lacticaseibacillus paracasei]RNE05602.1 hypothetical protein FAM22278_02192 [Lacticaseibacillus paracasei]
MTIETKRDVFEGLLESYMYSADMVIDEISTDGVADRLNLGNIIASTRDRYDNALPDDLPVIPKNVSEYTKRMIPIAVGRYIIGDEPLFSIFLTIQHNLNKDYPPDFKAENWIIHYSDTFARAWVLGVWRVEETGEITSYDD